MAKRQEEIMKYPETDLLGTFDADEQPDTRLSLEYNNLELHLGAVDALPEFNYKEAVRQLEARVYALRAMVQSTARVIKMVEDHCPEKKPQLISDYGLNGAIWDQYCRYASGKLIHGLAVQLLNYRIRRLKVEEQRRLLQGSVDIVDPQTREVRKISMEDLASEQARKQMIHVSLGRFQSLKEQRDWLSNHDREQEEIESQKPDFDIKYLGSGNVAKARLTVNGESVDIPKRQLETMYRKVCANAHGKKVKVIVQEVGVHHSTTALKGHAAIRQAGVLDESTT